MRLAKIEGVRRAFLDAPFSEDGWLTALRQLAGATGSSRAQLIGVGDRAALFNYMTDVDPAYQREFVEIEAWRPEVNWRVAVSGRTMEVISERHYDSARARLGSDVYDDHCRKWGGMYGAQTVLTQGRGELIGLALIRDESEGRTSSDERKLFAAAADYALAAVRMQRAMAQSGRQLLAGTLESLDFAAFLIDRDGGVAAMTPRAESLVSLSGGGVLRLKDRRLSATRGNAAFQGAVMRALAPATDVSKQVEQLWLETPQDQGPGLLCEIVRLPRREFAFGFDLRAMAIVRSAADLPEFALAPLRQALGLTVAEAEIALRLANGVDRGRIAAERATSTQTLATQIKSLLNKGAVTREAELVALVNRLMR